MRARLADGRHGAAQGLAERLRARDGCEDLGRLAGGIVAAHRGFHALAWAELAPLAPALWARQAPDECAQSGLRVAPARALAALRALARDGDPGVAPMGWYQLAGAAFGYGDQALAAALLDRAGGGSARVGGGLRAVLAPWVAADPGSPTAPATGRRTIAIMDYGHPGRPGVGQHRRPRAEHRRARAPRPPPRRPAARCAGARRTCSAGSASACGRSCAATRRRRPRGPHRGPRRLDVPADPGGHLGPLLRLVHARDVHAAPRLPAAPQPAADLRLLPLQQARPAHARGDRVPAALRAGRLPRLDDRATCSLRAACRPSSRAASRRPSTRSSPTRRRRRRPTRPPRTSTCPPARVPDGGVTYAHSDPAVRRRSFARNVGRRRRAARDLPARAPRASSPRGCTATCRCGRSGVDVEFRPHNRSDIRFDGLLDLGDAAFGAIRDGPARQARAVHAAILGGAPEDEVYGCWRELTAADVAAAEAAADAPPRRSRSAALAGAATARESVTARRRRRRRDRRRGRVPARAAGARSPCSSARCSSTRPGRCISGSSPGPAPSHGRAAARRPLRRLAFGWVPTATGSPRRAPPLRCSADCCRSADRAVVLPLPAVATGDVAELAALDLGGHAFAAPTAPARAAPAASA